MSHESFMSQFFTPPKKKNCFRGGHKQHVQAHAHTHTHPHHCNLVVAMRFMNWLFQVHTLTKRAFQGTLCIRKSRLSFPESSLGLDVVSRDHCGCKISGLHRLRPWSLRAPCDFGGKPYRMVCDEVSDKPCDFCNRMVARFRLRPP